MISSQASWIAQAHPHLRLCSFPVTTTQIAPAPSSAVAFPVDVPSLVRLVSIAAPSFPGAVPCQPDLRQRGNGASVLARLLCRRICVLPVPGHILKFVLGRLGPRRSVRRVFWGRRVRLLRLRPSPRA